MTTPGARFHFVVMPGHDLALGSRGSDATSAPGCRDAAAGDIDKDGTPDLVLSTGTLARGFWLGRLSGKTANLISQTQLSSSNQRVAWFLTGSIEDLNRDQLADTVITSSTRGASIRGLDGAAGKLLLTSGEREVDPLLGDVDGDKVPDPSRARPT